MLDLLWVALAPIYDYLAIKVFARLAYEVRKPTYDKIRKEKLGPCVEEIVTACNQRLSTNASVDEINKLIMFESASSTESKTEQVGKKLIISLSEQARKEFTLGYDTAEKVVIFVFQTTTKSLFKDNVGVGTIAQHVVLPDALSKIEPSYGNKFMSEKIVKQVAVEHFALTTDKPEFFKKKIIPLLKPGNDQAILDKLREEAEARKYTINPKSPIYEKFKRNEEMGSYIAEKDMVRLSLSDLSGKDAVYHYVRGLRYIYENQDCRLTDLCKGLGVAWGTAQWIVWKNWKNTKLVEKKGKRYRVSQKYKDIKMEIESGG
ncbi:TPA: hypothetical protein HA243_01280 [Candidatus Micrarchaeota archaeon]|nr:hypothetical protein [Candidatus Micrarchaeota archaeon]